MGLYYKSFIKRLEETYTGKDSFFSSKEYYNILDEYDIAEETLAWALNLDKFLDLNGIKNHDLRDKIQKFFEDNI